MASTRRRAKRNTEPERHKRQLMDIPLDVLIEIFLHLEPLDLLHLARTTKGLRGFLLDRTKSSALWKNAIGNVKEFPPCPDHLSPPAYAHLAFVPVCHRCFCPCETIEWELRMRCCINCFSKMTISRGDTRGNPDLIGYLNRLDLPIACRHHKLDSRSGLDMRVSLECVSVYASHSLSDWKVVKKRKRPRSVAFEEFLSQQNDYWRSIREHARLCQEWERERLTQKAAQLSRVRQQRVKDIKDKLEESGWADGFSSLSNDNNFLWLPEVRKFEPLTPTEWTKIRPQLISWVRKARKDLVWQLSMTAFSSACQSIDEELRSDTSLKVQPRGIDVAMLPAVRALLESGVDPIADQDGLKKKFLRMLLPAIRKWSSGAVEELEHIAREQLDLPPLSKPSCRPSVIFKCKICTRSVRSQSRLTFEKALSHDHLYIREREEDGRENGVEMSTHDKLVRRYLMRPRNIRVLQVDVTVSRRVENLIRRMGQNPSRVTYDELRRSTVKVVCELCRPQVATRMNFDDALHHCLSAHFKNKETKVWTRASARE